MLLGAGLGVAQAWPAQGVSNRIVVDAEHIWYSNESLEGAGGHVWSDSASGAIPTDDTYCFAYGLGSKLMNVVGPPGTAPLTGFSTPDPVSRFQRGIDDSTVGSTACQVAGRGMGFQLDKQSLAADNLIRPPGDIYGMQMVRNWGSSESIRPWLRSFGNTARLGVQANYAVTSRSQDDVPQYGQFSLSIVDTSLKSTQFSRSFWLTVTLWDSRGTSPVGVHLDTGGTNNYVVATRAEQGVDFVTLAPGSQNYEGDSTCDCVWYAVDVTRNNLVDAVTAINSTIGRDIYSLDPSDYAVNLVGVGTEMYSAPGMLGTVGSAVSDLRLSTRYRTLAVPDDIPTVYLRHVERAHRAERRGAARVRH